VRRNDTSATSIDEWTGEKLPAGGKVPDGIIPSEIQPVGNYAVLIMWEDGFNQVSFSSCPSTLSHQESFSSFEAIPMGVNFKVKFGL
jgi:hypothetical protein